MRAPSHVKILLLLDLLSPLRIQLHLGCVDWGIADRVTLQFFALGAACSAGRVDASLAANDQDS